MNSVCPIFEADGIILQLWRSVKYKEVYLKDYARVPELLLGLTTYFEFYNGERPHQALGYDTPDRVYATGQGGGALIVDKFGETAETASATPYPVNHALSGEPGQQPPCCESAAIA
jgi:hypothetical protein